MAEGSGEVPATSTTTIFGSQTETDRDMVCEDLDVDVVAVQPVCIVDHIIKVPDEERMRELCSEEDIGGSHVISAQEMDRLLSQVDCFESKPGGSASNVLRYLSRDGGLACSGRIVGARGSDAHGFLFEKSMRQRGIDTTYLYEKSGNTGCCCVLTCGNTRTMRPMFESAAKFLSDELEPKHIQGAKNVFVSAYCFYYEGMVERIVRLACDAGCRVALDLASFEIVRRFAKELMGVLASGCVDICFCNEDEAKEVALYFDKNCSTELYAECGARNLLNSGVSEAVIVTLGTGGSMLLTKDSKPHYEPAYPVPHVEDATGAGDAFSAGVLFGIVSGLDLTTCVKVGNIAGASVVQCLGSEMSEASWKWFGERMKELNL